MTSYSNMYNIVKTNPPFVGKYVRAQLEFYERHNEWYEADCFCESFENNLFGLRTKFNKYYYVPPSQVKNIINVNVTPKFKVGDIVLAVIDYHQIDGEQTDFCKILGVKIFCNDIDYDLEILTNSNKISIPQNNIKHIAQLKCAKYPIGAQVGVKYFRGPQWDTYEEIINGTIISLKEFCDKVIYRVKHDNGTLNDYVYEYNIVPPKKPEPVKTAEQLKQEQLTFLNKEEQRLLEQLELIRKQKQGFI